MTTLEQTRAEDRVAEKIKRVQALYADAPDVGRVALKNGLEALRHELAAATQRESAGRIGTRRGKVSELTAIIPLVPGGGRRIRGLLDLLEGNIKGADLVGTLHDMRFVLLDNDTKLFFATTFDGEWDAYIDDLVMKIPNSMDILFCNCDGWPGILSPMIKHWLSSRTSTRSTPGTCPTQTCPPRKRASWTGSARPLMSPSIGSDSAAAARVR